MDALFITSNTVTPATSPAGLASDPGAQPGSGDAGQSFGGIFNSLRPEVGRQDLAAVLFGGSGAMPQLVSRPLGQGMAVITPDSPTPGQDSLLAFARSQGLDETAIAALWQGSAPQTGPATPVATGSPTLPALSSSSLNPAGLSLDNANAAVLATLPAGALAPASGNPALAGLGLPLGSAGPATPADLQAPTPPTHATAQSAQVTILAVNIQTPAAPTPAATPEAATPEMDMLALQQMRAGLLQNSRNTQKPAGPASSAPAQTVQPPSASQDTPPLTLTLDLETDLADLARQALANPSDEPAPADPATSTTSAGGTLPLQTEAGRPGGQNNPSGSATAAPTPAHTTISGYQLKAEHYQQLADRMGQALAQRLQDQIERGQWSMKLRLNPAELGQIDVQLDMKQSGLDARFQTDNPLTKDLILQGSGRLKDSFNQSGMTIASVSVNDDGQRQRGGNPTPQQQRRPTSSQTATPRTEAVGQPSARTPQREDGWDMLA